MPDSKFHDILRQYWGYPDFRGIQLDIIESIAARHDTLGLMPTGGGKSITFQVPALAADGMCIVVTPLIALMKDQVMHLEAVGIRATAVYSGLSHDEIMKRMDNAVFGAYKFLYVSPERLATPLFLNKVRRMKVSFITVDEAHCISQWGYDFRPHYLRIAEVRDLLPGVPVLALTATATEQTIADIRAHLKFRDDNVFRMSYERKNLRYVVRRTHDKTAEMIHIISRVEGAVIVYSRSRSGTRELAELLEAEGISATYYHAGLSSVEKDVRQRAWQDGEARVMVATNAFGMGIDKSDVRLVLHYEMPDSIEAYYQEAGRAGRDGRPAFCVLLYTPHDAVTMRRRINETYPPKDYVADVYEKLAYFFAQPVGEGAGRSYEFNVERFCRVYKYFPTTMVSALNLLTQAGYIDFRLEDNASSRLMFVITRDSLYRLPEMQSDAESVMSALLRLYCGLFADYVPIDEARIAAECGIDEHRTYEALKALTRHRVVHYVPSKHVPRVTYVTNRIDGDRVRLPREVYDERRDAFARRIEAVIGYVQNENVCRSLYLLNYFSDRSAAPCGGCDVCLNR